MEIVYQSLGWKHREAQRSVIEPKINMKIAVITDIFPNSAQPWRGHSVYQTVRRLGNLAEVEVFAPFAHYPSFAHPRSLQPVRFDYQYQPDGVKTHYFEYWAFPLLTRIWNGKSVYSSVCAAVEKFNPDLILSYFVYPEGYGALKVGKRLKKPVIVKAIGTDLNVVSNSIIEKFKAEVLSDSDMLLTVSHALRTRALELGAKPEKTVAILNGCDGHVFRTQERDVVRKRLGYAYNPRLILYVGRLDLRKGMQELVAASAELRRARQDFTTLLMGEGQDQERVEGWIRDRAADDYIKIIPPGPSELVADWMAAADLVTLPSYAEGCPNVVIEALTCGRPMVATNVGGIPELMDESCGRMVPKQDASALRAALDETLDIVWDAKAIAATRRRTWEEVADDTFAIFQEVLRVQPEGAEKASFER
jgi:glycosyltransferase involved in cell wall biosynthesis